MSLEEKIKSIESITSSNLLSLFKKVREDKDRVNKLIENLQNEYDMPSAILREMRENNEIIFNVLVNNNVLDYNLNVLSR